LYARTIVVPAAGSRGSRVRVRAFFGATAAGADFGALRGEPFEGFPAVFVCFFACFI
jgi:hypothetical protein